MKIIRDGKEIELTSNELYGAWSECQHEFDRKDVGKYLSWYLVGEDIPEEEREEILNNDDLMDDVATYWREYLDNQNPRDLRWDCMIDAYEKAKKER